MNNHSKEVMTTEIISKYLLVSPESGQLYVFTDNTVDVLCLFLGLTHLIQLISSFRALMSLNGSIK